MTTTDTALPLAPGTWTLDPSHSTIGFTIRHLGISRVRGRFADVDTRVVVGPDLASTTVEADVDLASVDTGNPDRDAHLRAPDMLDVATRGRMSFRSTALTGADGAYTLAGDLTIGDVTRPITFDVEFGGMQDFVDGSRRAGFEATGQLRRTDYGLDLGVPAGLGNTMLSDVVKIELDVQLIEPAAGTA